MRQRPTAASRESSTTANRKPAVKTAAKPTEKPTEKIAAKPAVTTVATPATQFAKVNHVEPVPEKRADVRAATMASAPVATAARPAAEPVSKPAQPAVEPKVDRAASAVSADERARMIAMAAYFRAERRGFSPGQDVEDWLEAEAEVDRYLSR